jgi:hypothetical protein
VVVPLSSFVHSATLGLELVHPMCNWDVVIPLSCEMYDDVLLLSLLWSDTLNSMHQDQYGLLYCLL